MRMNVSLCSIVCGSSSHHHPVQKLCSPVPLERTPQTVVSEPVFVISFSWVAFPKYRETKDRYFNIHLFYYTRIGRNEDGIFTPTCSRARIEDFFALEEYEREHDLLQKRLELEKKVTLAPGVPHISHNTEERVFRLQTNTQVTFIVG